MRNFIPFADGISTISPAEDARRQKAASDAARQLIDELRAKEAEQAAARDRLDAERGQAELDGYRTEARASMRASGGSSADFDRLWPELKSDHLKARALERLGAKGRRVQELYERMTGGQTPRP